MDTTPLETASNAVVADARRSRPRGPQSHGECGAPLVLAHLTAVNRCLAELIAVVLSGVDSAPYSSLPTVQPPYLDAIVVAAGSWEGMIDRFERSSREVIWMVARVDPHAEATPIDVVLWEQGAVALDRRMPLADLVDIVRHHLVGHTAQLTGALDDAS